ncbi:hypothetical protein AeRB84_015592 [Aphanomyces euteiches]|nr:hypothetical protein AeRB84_015592 [Aphanomyces euteiches]
MSTPFYQKMHRYRGWEFVTNIVVIIAVFAFTSLGLHQRPIPRVVVQLNETHVIYARDASIDLKKGKEQVPMWLAVVIFYAVPVLTHALLQWLHHIHNDTRDFFLTLITATTLTQLFTNFAKVVVGRFRPSFYDMCDWDMSVVWDGVTNLCRDPDGEKEGRKSFPSGHSSGAFSTLFLLTLYLLGRSKVLTSSVLSSERGILVSIQFFAAFIPTMLAVWICITRSQDNWHHYSDILAGIVIGAASSLFAYTQNYASPFNWCVDCTKLKELLRTEVDEKEELKLRLSQEKERFADEFKLFETRLLRANATLDKNRQILELSMLEKDAMIEKMQLQLGKQRHTIEWLKTDPRIQLSASRRSQSHQDDGFSEAEEDSKVYQLESQISKLFAQLKEAEKVNEQQAQRIESRKAANNKLMQALKHMKRKLDDEANSGVHHMLQDIQHKYIRLESDKNDLSAAMDKVQGELETLRGEKEALEASYKSSCAQIQSLEGLLAEKDLKLQDIDAQIRKQQLYIKDLEMDYKVMSKMDLKGSEREQMQRILARKNDDLIALESKCKQYAGELDFIRRQTQGSENDSAATKRLFSLIDVDQVHSQVLKVECKAQAVSRMMSMIEDGNHRDIQALLVDLDNAPIPSYTLTSEAEGKQRILMSLMESQTLLDNLSHQLANALARNLGAQCAMQ